MADAVKISDLPDVSSFGPADQFIVNDVATGSDGVTSLISVGSFVGWLTSQDLQFSGNIELGGIVPGPSGLNITVNGIYVKDSIEIDPFANVSGIDIDDLDDVLIGKEPLEHGHVLMWDSVESSWVHNYVDLSNAGDTTSIQFDLLRDSIDTLNDSIDTLTDSIGLLQDQIDDLQGVIDDGIDNDPNDGRTICTSKWSVDGYYRCIDAKYKLYHL